MDEKNDNFYEIVSEYYDQDADFGFEERAASNPLLERIRNDFRKITVEYPFSNALEIGCGPGLDIEWFAQQFPDKQFVGIDISEKMIDLAGRRVAKSNLTNATVKVGDERTLKDLRKEGLFDLVYVYFGALNTVKDLSSAAEQIYASLNDQWIYK